MAKESQNSRRLYVLENMYRNHQKEPRELKRELESGIALFSGNAFITSSLKYAATLVDYQITLEINDEKSSSKTFQDFPRSPLLLKPLAYTFHYCNVYHFKDTYSLGHPDEIKDRFHLHDRRIAYTVVMARAQVGDWSAVIDILRRKTKKAQLSFEPIIGFEPFLEVVEKYNGPKALSSLCLEYVTPLEKQYTLCVQYKLYELAANVAITLNDKKRASELKHLVAAELEPKKAEAFKKFMDEAIQPKAKKSE